MQIPRWLHSHHFLPPTASFMEYSDQGESAHIFELGLACFSAVVVVTSLRVAIETHLHHWTFQVMWFSSPPPLLANSQTKPTLSKMCSAQAFLLISAGSLLPSIAIFGLWDADGMKGGVSRVFGSAAFWVRLAVVSYPCSCL